MMEFLPREIILDILSRLPVTSLLQCKLVCRTWKHLAQDPLLVGMHFSRSGKNDLCLILHCDYPTRNQLYSIKLSPHSKDNQRVNIIHVPPLPKFDVLGSCKGLLCLCDSLTKNSLYIYNPFTRDYIELPKCLEFHNQDVVLGFVFHETTKEYKVIKVVYCKPLRSPFRGIQRRAGSIISPESEVQILELCAALRGEAWGEYLTIFIRGHHKSWSMEDFIGVLGHKDIVMVPRSSRLT